ncbi:MAG: 6-phosphofructokinase, partial [Caldilineaceae bacterium]|nr:6-phosphofructokinase [Caldilineaceae bacterium]
GGDLFDVRMAVLGHLQQGGDPTPYDRIMATRLASDAITFIEQECGDPKDEAEAVCIGMVDDVLTYTPLYTVPRIFDEEFQRPKKQWWMRLRPLARMLAQPSAEYQESVWGDVEGSA